MRVKHVMTKDPSACVPSDSAQHAARIMREQDAGIIPVIDNELSRKVVGVVTDRDLCMNIVADGHPPHAVSVEECMTTKVVICSPTAGPALRGVQAVPKVWFQVVRTLRRRDG